MSACRTPRSPIVLVLVLAFFSGWASAMRKGKPIPIMVPGEDHL